MADRTAAAEAADLRPIVAPGLHVDVQLNAAFMERARAVLEAARAAGVEPLPLKPHDADYDVVFQLRLLWTIPLLTSNEHPRVELPVLVLDRRPLSDVKRAVRDALGKAGHQELVACVKLDDGAGTT